MPRDAAATRMAMVDQGRRLFARSGVFATPLKSVVDAAGQRNTSALHYHFGGREGLLAAIIESHNTDLETQRAGMLDALGPNPGLRPLVEAVVLPQARLLDDPAGRQFLSIISQLVDLFDQWDVDDPAVPAQALRALRAIAGSLDPTLAPPVRRERVTHLLALVSASLGARARQVDRGRPTTLDTAAFTANLVDMAVGALSADPGPIPDLRSPPAPAGSR
jgi:AcrR family transcriptional regulator